MDYEPITAWNIIKRFLISWMIVGVIMVIVSCIKYKGYIVTAFCNNTLEWINVVIPIVIIVYIIRALLR